MELDGMARLYPDGFALCVCLLILADMLGAGRKRAPEERMLLTMTAFQAGLLVLHGTELLAGELPGAAARGVVWTACLLSAPLYVGALVLCCLFVGSQVRGRRMAVRGQVWLALPAATLLILPPLNLPAGWVYHIGSDGQPQTGPLGKVLCVFFLLAVAAAAGCILLRLRHFDRGRAVDLLLLLGLLFAGQLLLLLPGGYEISVLLLTLGTLAIFFEMQNRMKNTDYLTGLSNRAQMDRYIRAKILRCTPNHTFSCIMIDLDNFKEINDRFGHNIGDEALETAARLMKSSLRRGDFLARIGGDEFIVVLDEGKYENLEKAAVRIRETFDRFNAHTVRPFHLALSMGYDVYRFESHMTWPRFYRRVDRLMYENKKERKEIAPGELPAD